MRGHLRLLLLLLLLRWWWWLLLLLRLLLLLLAGQALRFLEDRDIKESCWKTSSLGAGGSQGG